MIKFSINTSSCLSSFCSGTGFDDRNFLYSNSTYNNTSCGTSVTSDFSEDSYFDDELDLFNDSDVSSIIMVYESLGPAYDTHWDSQVKKNKTTQYIFCCITWSHLSKHGLVVQNLDGFIHFVNHE